MPAIASNNLQLLRSGKPVVKRYLSVCPRTPVFQAQLVDVLTDENTNAVVALTYTGVTLGSYEDALPGYTLDIGTVAGLADVGQVRVRKAATDTDLYIAETSLGAFNAPLTAGLWLTVVEERRIWQKLPYLDSETSSGAQYADSFVAYVDYDLACDGSELYYYAPLANIEGDPAGWVDTGKTYRTVTLSGTKSASLSDWTIASYQWDIADGTLVDGYDLTDATIQARFPQDTMFRYVSLTVTHSGGLSSTRYFPIFVHSDDYPPLPYEVGFTVDRDETVEGREMDFTIFGQDYAVQGDVIPKGTLFVYWEDYQVGGVKPTQYRSQFVGWSVRETLLHRAHRSRYTVSVAGPHYWLNQISGFAESFLEYRIPSTWYMMHDPTDDKAIATILRYRSTALDVCNLYPSGVTDVWRQHTTSQYAAIKVEQMSLWEQVLRLAEEYSGVAGVDTWGSIWLRQHPCIVDDDARNAIAEILTLTEGDWQDDAPLTMVRELVRTVGSVQLDGFYFDGGLSALFPLRARAPGRAPDYGTQFEQIATQILPTTNAGQVLAERAGHWWAWMNNPSRDLVLQLTFPLNCIEPAWAEWLRIDAAVPTVRGEVVAGRFVVSGVSVSHRNQHPYHKVTLTISAESRGEPGDLVPIPELSNLGWTADLPSNVGVTTPGSFNNLKPADWSWVVDIPGWPDIGELGSIRILLPCSDGYMYITENPDVPYSEGGPTFTRASMGVSGTPVAWSLRVNSPFYTSGTGNIEGWLATTTGIYKVTVTEANEVSSSLQHTFDQETMLRSMDFSYSVDGHGVCMSVSSVGVVYTYTTDGTTWTEEVLIGVEPEFGELPDTVLPDLNDDGWYIQQSPGHEIVWLEDVPKYMQWFSAVDSVAEDFPFVEGEIIGFGYHAFGNRMTYGQGGASFSYDSTVNVFDWSEFDQEFLDIYPYNLHVEVPEVGAGHIPGQDENLYVGGSRPIQVYISPRDSYTFQQITDWVKAVDVWQRFSHGVQLIAVNELSPSFSLALDGQIYSLFHFTVHDWPSPTVNMQVWAWYYVYAPYYPEGTELYPPGCFVSGKVDGRVYTSAYVGDGTECDGYAGQDVFSGNGISRIDSAPVDGPDITLGATLAGDINVPYAAENENIVYYAGDNGDGERRVYRIDYTGLNRKDITPMLDGEAYAPWKSKFQISTFNGDPNRVIVVGRNSQKTKYAVFESVDGGRQWTVLAGPMAHTDAHVTRAMYAGDTPDFAFLVGTKGLFGILDGPSLDDRSGNIPTSWPDAGEFIGVVGG